MSNSDRQGRPGDEMFMNQQRPADRDSPTIVEPLRINKRHSGASQASTTSQQYPAPEQRSASQTAYPMPALPYPDARSRTASPPAQSNGAAAPYPYPDVRHVTSPEQRTGSAGSVDYKRRAGSTSSQDYTASMRPGTLAERRGTSGPKPLPDSPGPEAPDKEGLFQRAPQREGPESAPLPAAAQQFFPPPSVDYNRLRARDPSAVNRISSTASTSTTRATRGSPPPPETPVTGPGQHAPQPPGGRPQTDIEARYAASGIAGTNTLNSLQAQSLASQQRAAQYAGQQPANATGAPPARPWTPTEQPGSSHHPTPTVYQGASAVDGHSPPQQPAFPAQQQQPGPQQATSPSRIPQNPMENEMNRLSVHDEPPPAYSQVPGSRQGAYPSEKQRRSTAGAGAGAGAGGLAAVAAANATQQHAAPPPNQQDHPAFANDPRQQQQQQPPQQSNGVGSPVHQVAQQQQQAQPQVQQPQQALQSPGTPSHAPASPPPLPEGWIAHLDPNSGQYYYIHLPTQATQWEFPKGPTPLNLGDTPLSPAGSTFQNPLASPGLSFTSGKPLASPGLPMTPGYDHSGSLSNPATFTGPPPASGVELYKVAATNGVYFGPYLRYANMDIERGLWLGSIMLVTDAPQPPTIHIHQSTDLSPNPRQLKALNIATHQRWTFYKYEIDLRMDDGGASKWTYAITSHLGCTRYEFLVAGRHETNWRFIATSGNDFSLNVNANERQRLGGVGFMWKDIMQKHAECGGFHAQLGLGSQIYADRLWKEIPSLKQWLALSGKENRKNSVWTAAHEEDVTHAFFHYYTSHFDQPYLREAFAQIPHVLTLDDHDIFDGFGSYPEYMQFSNMFKNIGRIGIEMYLLFQHHTTLEILRNVSDDTDLFTITGTGWHFVKFLGPAVALVGPDTRSERNPHQVLAGPTYQGLFPKIATLPQSVQHCILLLPVPVVYPRLEAAEQFANSVATGKKAVTGAYNMLGKVTAGVAGVVGAKGAVGSGFDTVKRAVGKSGLMGGILSPFGEIDVLDELKDQWTHESKVCESVTMGTAG